MSAQGEALWLAVGFAFACVGCAGLQPEAPDKTFLSAKDETPVFEEVEEAPIEVELPDLPSNASCQRARSAYHDAWSLAGGQRADLTNGQYGSVLARNGYFRSCNVPARYEIEICAAVQNGEVQGATVKTEPRNPRIEKCIDRGVRKLHFPTHPRMDITTTVFAASS